MVERNMQKSKIKIIDNFLPIHKFNTIKKDLESENFPWYWQENSHAIILMVNGKQIVYLNYVMVLLKIEKILVIGIIFLDLALFLKN